MDYIKKYKVNFTQVSNTVLNDSRLSLKAKGLYAYLFSKPENWVFHVSVMEKELKESKGQIYTTLKELIQFGYIERKQVNENGVFGGVVYEFIENPHTEIPCTDFSAHGKTDTHNNIDNKVIYTRNNKDNKLLCFGELSKVNLTQEEFDKIKQAHPNSYETAIEKLDSWLATTTKKVKNGSHYAYFKSNSWVWDGLKEEKKVSVWDKNIEIMKRMKERGEL